VIINEDFDRAIAELSAIVIATRQRYASQAARHHALFAQLGIAN
jgi:guanylate kinase